jgi:hypothetical protein
MNSQTVADFVIENSFGGLIVWVIMLALFALLVKAFRD